MGSAAESSGSLVFCVVGLGVMNEGVAVDCCWLSGCEPDGFVCGLPRWWVELIMLGGLSG